MTMTTAALAAAIDTTPRELRKFLRSEGSGVGKGSRYALPSSKREVNALSKRFTAWSEAKAKKVEDAPEETPQVETDETPSLDEMTHPADA